MRAGVPYVFLLTDGAVDNERSICRHLEAYQARPPAPGTMHARVSTFAIGPFCNHFFLKQLAASGAEVHSFRMSRHCSLVSRSLMTAMAQHVPQGNLHPAFSPYMGAGSEF